MLVRDCMTTEVVTVSDDASLKDAARLLVERRVSGLPVVNDSGTIVGVLSEADFVTAAGGKGSLRKLVMRVLLGDVNAYDSMPESHVRDVMSSPARTIAPSSSTTQAAGLMAKWKVNRLPVVDDGRLVGIITRADIVKTFTRSDSELLAAVELALEPFEDVKVIEVSDGVAVIEGQVRYEEVAGAARSQVAFVPGVIQVDARQLTWHVRPRSK